jgi:hypothetical protein
MLSCTGIIVDFITHDSPFEHLLHRGADFPASNARSALPSRRGRPRKSWLPPLGRHA